LGLALIDIPTTTLHNGDTAESINRLFYEEIDFMYFARFFFLT